MHIALNTHDCLMIYKIMEEELRLARIGTQAFASLA
jgi:mRNA-degrading endonuclease YafQ of YafQ-DinJ toxin-antitoxin module